jgi:hypothetical protein
MTARAASGSIRSRSSTRRPKAHRLPWRTSHVSSAAAPTSPQTASHSLVEDTDEGPEYWHVPFGVDLKAIPREEREEFLARRREEFLRWVEEQEEP